MLRWAPPATLGEGLGHGLDPVAFRQELDTWFGRPNGARGNA